MTVKLLTEHKLEFLSLKGGCTSSSESTIVKTPHCWKPNVVAQILLFSRVLLRLYWVLLDMLTIGTTHVSESSKNCPNFLNYIAP